MPSFFPQGQFIHTHSDMTLELKWFFFHPPLKKDIKGIAHPKMKIVSSFTHPQVVPNLYECLCSAEHKGRYFEECGKQSSSGAPLTSIMFFFPTMEVNGAPKQPGYKLSSEYLSFLGEQPYKCKEQNVYRNIYRCGINLARFVDLTWHC